MYVDTLNLKEDHLADCSVQILDSVYIYHCIKLLHISVTIKIFHTLLLA